MLLRVDVRTNMSFLLASSTASGIKPPPPQLLRLRLEAAEHPSAHHGKPFKLTAAMLDGRLDASLGVRLNGARWTEHGVGGRQHGVGRRLHDVGGRSHGMGVTMHGVAEELHDVGGRLHNVGSRLHVVGVWLKGVGGRLQDV